MLTIFAVLFDARQRGVEDGAATPTVTPGCSSLTLIEVVVDELDQCVERFLFLLAFSL